MTDEYECENCTFWCERDPRQPPPGVCPVCGEPMHRVGYRAVSRKMLDKVKGLVRKMAGRG